MIAKYYSCFFFLYIMVITVAAQLRFSGLTPPQQSIKEPVTVSISREMPSRRDTLVLTLALSMEKHIHVYAAESLFFKISFSKQAGLGKGRIKLPQPGLFTDYGGTTAAVFTDGQRITLKYPILSDQWALQGGIRFQACDTLMCYTPRTIAFAAASDGTLFAAHDTSVQQTLMGGTGEAPADLMQMLDGFSVVGSRAGFMSAERFMDFLRDPARQESGRGGEFQNKGLFLVILFVLLGGVALNLTPCVLPMIPVTIAVIGAGSQAKSRRRGMFAGAVYGGAMALTYGALGVFVILTGRQFGVINASPLFNLAVAAVFIVMALAMFDIFSIDFTRFRKAGGFAGERGKLLTAFAMGIVASLLAGACVAPVVISVVLYAGTLFVNGNPAGLALPFVLGAGMALPWPFAGAGLSFLPRPGKWMVWVKYVFGAFILAMALYYGATGINLYRAASAAVPKTDNTAKGRASLYWLRSIEEGLQQARSENKPVFIDFWSSWCKNCKTMEATTFRDKRVEELFRRYVLVKYQAERPGDPSTKAVLDRFGVMGLPTYVVLKAKE